MSFASCRVGPEVVGSLRREAARLDFTNVEDDGFGIVRAERLLASPFHLAYAPARSGISRHVAGRPPVRDAVASLTDDAEMRVFSATFLFYAAGAYLGCHTDRPGCDLTVVLSVSGRATTVELFPQLVDHDLEDLLAECRAGGGFLEGARPAALERPGDGVAFNGRATPHQRRPVPDPLLLFSICFSRPTAD